MIIIETLQIQNELLKLYEEEYDKLYSIVFRMTGNHHDAEDAMQNAFLKAIKHFQQFRGEAKLSTWLYRILVNEGNKNYKQIRKLPVVAITQELGVNEEDFFSGLESPDEPIDNRLMVDEMREKCLTAFMRCLPKQQRAVFVLRTFLNLTLSEIAEVLVITENNAKVTLYRARKNIQELHHDRCSLVDPSKPCKCYLWIKFMKDRNLPMPKGYTDYKDPEMVDEYKQLIRGVLDVYAMYKVGRKIPKVIFIKKLREKVL
ncbi:RNA polymerase sigma factor [Anoxybacterium hadale]|uniref:RNA polymerase sigma factor n=1 Tax=Anoxybacterium hadale TaxID=3408580 RepID=UPI003AFF8847